VAHLDAAEGSAVELGKVLLMGDGERVTVGTPVVEGAKVLATAQGEVKGDKIVIFKYKAKVRYRRKTGHRQLFTRLLIDKIVEPGAREEEPPEKGAEERGD